MTEIQKLKKLLIDADIFFGICDLWGGEQVIYYHNGDRICDAVCHSFSYGHEKGLLEMMGLCETEDEVEGYLTAEEVFKRIQKYHLTH